MKVLITGGAGFIGSHLCKKLSNKGYDIVVLDNLITQVHGNEKDVYDTSNIIREHADLFNLDASDIDSWKPFYGVYFDSIICLAAETGTGQSMMNAASYCNSNVTSMALLNDLIVNGYIKCGKVILASSRAIYGDAKLDKYGNPIATKESDDKDPRSIYAITKLAQEHVLFTGFPNTSVCALRLQNVYGPGQSLKNPYTGILSIFSTVLKNGKDIQVFGDGMMSRDFVYIDDVVDSFILVIENNSVNEKVFNVGSGIPTTVLKVAQTLKTKYESQSNINITGESMSGDIRHNFADISKIKNIGFKPKVFFDEGIQQFVDWVNSNGIIHYNNYDSSLNDFRKKKLLK